MSGESAILVTVVVGERVSVAAAEGDREPLEVSESGLSGRRTAPAFR